MDKIELIQLISFEVCPECDADSECGEDVTGCVRMAAAIKILDRFLAEWDDGR